MKEHLIRPLLWDLVGCTTAYWVAGWHAVAAYLFGGFMAAVYAHTYYKLEPRS